MVIYDDGAVTESTLVSTMQLPHKSDVGAVEQLLVGQVTRWASRGCMLSASCQVTTEKEAIKHRSLHVVHATTLHAQCLHVPPTAAVSESNNSTIALSTRCVSSTTALIRVGRARY